MEMELFRPATPVEVLADLLGPILVANLLLPAVYAAVFVVSFFQRARQLPAPFRTFLRIARWLHVLALFVAFAVLLSAPLRSAVDSGGAGHLLVYQVVLPSALLGLFLTYFLQRRCSPEEPTSLALQPPAPPPA